MEGIYLMVDKQSKSFIFTGINEIFFDHIILKELVFHSNLSNKTFVFIAVLTMYLSHNISKKSINKFTYIEYLSEVFKILCLIKIFVFRI